MTAPETLEGIKGFDFVTVAIPVYEDESKNNRNVNDGVFQSSMFLGFDTIKKCADGTYNEEKYEDKTRIALSKIITERYRF